MTDFQEKTTEEWNLIGQSICDGKDWRWVSIWAYNIHKMFRTKFPPIKVWEELDLLIGNELEWHQGKNLFGNIRKLALQSELKSLKACI